LQEARLFGPALFEAAKLKVLFLGSEKEHPDELPRIYTLTHSDVTSKITLAISREINKAQVLSYFETETYAVREGFFHVHVCCFFSFSRAFGSLSKLGD
jgi:hypothetical protein